MFSSSNLQTGNLGHPYRKGNERFKISFPYILAGLALLMTLAALMLAPVNSVMGQESDMLESGRAVIGSIDAANPSATYIFSGQAGDVVIVRAFGLTPEMDPNLTLMGPNQADLLYNDNEPFVPINTTAGLVYRLTESGTYTVQVSGSEGSFLLVMSLLSASSTTQLQIDSAVTVSLPAQEDGQVFVFDTDPLQSRSILIETNPLDADVQINVRSTTGASVALLRQNLHNACLGFEPGDQQYEVTVQSTQETEGTVTLTLSNATCGFDEPVTSDVTRSQTEFSPVEVEGVCVVSNHSNVNIRTGDSTDYNVVAQLPAQQAINVVGQNADGTWYAVENEALTGWISASVVFVTGPCDDLPVVPVMDTSMPEATPEMTEEPDPEMTPEATPEMTEEPGPETTPEPTPDPETTPEATESP